MKKLLLYIDTTIKLGILNVIYVIWYRIGLKIGFRIFFFKQELFAFSGEFFIPTKIRTDYPDEWKKPLLEDAERIVNGQLRYYAHHWNQVGNPPNWFINPFNGAIYPNSNLHWTKLGDFNAEVGDIKNIWEASRFEWVVTLSRAFAVTGQKIYIDTLNNWLIDWAIKNPVNTGPNCKCGQEASIRVFNLLNASLILKQADQPSQNLSDFIYAHLERIQGNILYAIAQDNNHGTSEAAALFIGGTWLGDLDSKHYPKAFNFSRKGRFWLENRVNKLIETDGSFSQHSVTYHRVLLDTLCFAEFWRSKLNKPQFSSPFYQKAKAATHWLQLLTDKRSGDAPNLGANDGALFLNLHSSNYRDFRPTLQLANSLFNLSSIDIPGTPNEVLYWFELDKTKSFQQNIENSISLKGGYTYINSLNSWAFVRWPYFRFRPSHNDVMHFDLWFKGQNVIIDAGSYSYNPPISDVQIDLKSVHCHNTVSFDGKEQMPKLGRFLLGNWLKTENISKIKNNSDGSQGWSGSYLDNYGNHHLRSIIVTENIWQINDCLSGNFKEATIGFNISDINCILFENVLQTTFGNLTFSENSGLSLVDSYVSNFYQEKHNIKRLVIKVSKPGTYLTTIELK